MKKTALALCAFTVLAASAANAQSTPATTPINPPASTTTSPAIAPPSPTNNAVGPANNINGDLTQPANSTLRNDVSNTPADPLDPTVDPLDARGTLDTKPTDNVTPLTPQNSTPLPESQSTVNPTNSTLNNSVNNNSNDVSSLESSLTRSSRNYDTDNDGMLDTVEALRGPVNPEIQPSAPAAQPMETTEPAEPQP